MRKRAVAPEVLEIKFNVSALASSQHRAGMAGLVIAADWVRQEYNCRGICEIDFSKETLTLHLDQLGLAELFNDLYAASTEEQERPKPIRNLRTGQVIPPIREVSREVEDSKNGSLKNIISYIYESVVPRGSFLAELDPTAGGGSGLWIKLWRDVVWTILRGVPATRKPYEARANDEPVNDYKSVWSDLCRGEGHGVQLPGTYFIGAQTYTSENVSFRDGARSQFLLNFWPLIAQIYVPVNYDPVENIEFRGFVIAVPDVVDLVQFCRIFPGMMKSRGTDVYKPRQYRPREAIVESIEEAGLNFLLQIKNQLKFYEQDSSLGGLGEVVSGVDLFHLERQGNSVRLLNSTRIDAEVGLVNDYAALKAQFWSPIFLRQATLNLLNRVGVWYDGFDRLLEQSPLSQTFSNSLFRHDLQYVFAAEAAGLIGEERLADTMPLKSCPDLSGGSSVEEMVYRVVANYLDFKLNPPRLKDSQNEDESVLDARPQRMKVARDAFLALRKRRGDDFREFFISTICGIRQVMDEEGDLKLSRLLVEETDRIRTLALLALTAQSTIPKQGSAADGI